MVFSSIIFLTVFLPVFLAIYYAVPEKRHSLVILLGSYIFYAWWRVDFVILFGVVTFFNYYISKHIVNKEYKVHKKRYLTIGVAGNLCTLGFFKYFNFGVDSMNSLMGYAGIAPVTVWNIILPIGISFYIFQAISYLVDVYRGDAEIADSFLDFAAFIALFPQLIAGPVIRYKDVADQFRHRTHTLAKFNEGAIRFSIGFCKKIFIADTLAPVADMAFSRPDPTFIEAWLGVLAYTAQLYFDFSGYSHMAIGLGLMMGFRFIENFNHPYISRSITEFWRRWHISLSTWLRDYVYIPLGGNKKGKIRTYVNLLLTMLLGGLWHGANWTFVLWGAWHGGILAIERYIGAKKGSPYPKLIAMPLTFLFVMIGWVLFRATDVTAAIGVYQGMLGMNGFGLSNDIAWSISRLQYATLIIAYIIVFVAPYSFHAVKTAKVNPNWAAELSLKSQVAICFLMILAVCKLIAQSFSPFLYFQF